MREMENAINPKKTASVDKEKIVCIALCVLKYIIMVLSVVMVILPLIPVLFGSLKGTNEYLTSSALALPTEWKFENYLTALVDGNMLLGFGNTMFIMVVSLAVSVITGSMTAYILQRFKFRGSKIIKSLFLIAALMPAVTNNIALFQIMSALDLFNTYWAGILLFSGTDIISVYIFIQFIDNVSASIDESAMIDGASYPRIFFTLILPLLLPAIATVLIIKGVSIYNDFTTPFLFMPDSDLAMLSTSLYNFQGASSQWEIVCAGIIIITVPMLIIFLALQKWIYSGLAVGSVKE